MKKIILMALLALLGVTQMAAQEHEYIPFVREGVKWVYYTRDTYARPHNHALELKGDVEINGKMYKAMHKYSGEQINWEEDTIPVYLREEGKVVYGIVPDGKTYNDCPVGNDCDEEMMAKIAAGEEFILFDFNDPVKFVDEVSGLPSAIGHHVIEDMINVGGKQARRYVSMYLCQDRLPFTFCLVEGIGYDGNSGDVYPLSASCRFANGGIGSFYAEENGEVIYEGLTYDAPAPDPYLSILPIAREGVKWVNERVVIDHGKETRSYYTYEFKNGGRMPICYQYTGDVLDENTATVAATLVWWTHDLEYCFNYEFMNNVPYAAVKEERRDMVNYDFYCPNFYGSYHFAHYDATIDFLSTENYYITHQNDEFLTQENFIKVEPLVIEGRECWRYAYIGEDGEPLAYITEGIGFDSRDMGDLLTPFTRKPDPDAEHQEYWGLSHVIKDGEIIYKGMRYDAAMFEGTKGDVNGDGKVDISDATALIDLLLQDHAMFRSPCDLDGNGLLGINDLTGLIDLLLAGNE